MLGQVSCRGYMSTSSKLKSQFVRPIVVGLVSAVGAMAMGDQYKVTTVFGNLSKSVFYGGLGVASSLATETLHQWILPMLPQSDSAVKAENALLSPAIHAGLNFLALKLLYPDVLDGAGFQEPLIIGAGAEVVGTYGFDAFIAPQIMQ